jgi:hypothetical protein
VAQALEGLKGVKRANASHPEKTAFVVYDPASVTLEEMRQALLKAGYVASWGDHQKPKPGIFKPFSAGKEGFQSDDLVCFCFGFTRNDIEKDFIENGQSAIMAEIAAAKKSGGCDCAHKNPKGR